MKKLIELVDGLLAKVVERDEAGACVPTAGDACNWYKQYKCDSDYHVKYYRWVKGYVQCTGTCGGSISGYGPWISYTRC